MAALNILFHLLLLVPTAIAGVRVNAVVTNIINELNSSVRPGERRIPLGGGNPFTVLDLVERHKALYPLSPFRRDLVMSIAVFFGVGFVCGLIFLLLPLPEITIRRHYQTGR